MRKPSPSQLDAARRVLDGEARDGHGAPPAAARRVCERILADLGLLMGATAARAILARSVKLAATDHALLAKVDLTVCDGATLTERIEQVLGGEMHSDSVAAAAALYATLRLLLETLVGERLTAKLLPDPWPGDPAAPKETK